MKTVLSLLTDDSISGLMGGESDYSFVNFKGKKFVESVGRIKFNTLIEEGMESYPVFLSAASTPPVKNYLIKAMATGEEGELLKAINDELERFDLPQVSSIEEFLEEAEKPYFSEYVSSVVDEVVEKRLYPFLGLPLTDAKVVKAIIERIGELFAVIPVIKELPVMNAPVNLSKQDLKEVLRFSKKEVIEWSNPFKKGNDLNVVKTILKNLSEKNKELTVILRRNEEVFRIPLTLTEILFG